MRYIPGKENSSARQPASSERNVDARFYAHAQPRSQASEACAAPAAAGDGYNSDDERASRRGGGVSYQSELEFINALWRTRGWQVLKMREDGACLFRSVAFHIYGDQEMHGQVRQLCMDYMVQNRDHFAEFIAEDFNLYIERKRHEREHGNHIEIQAISELFNRCVEVYHYSDEPLNIFQPLRASEAPIRLLYHGNHYDAIHDPARPTFGVGLGFTDLRPGAAEQNLMEAAEQASLSQVLVDSCCKQSDWETTEAEIEAAIMAQSRAQSREVDRQSDLEATDADIEAAILAESREEYERMLSRLE